MTQTVTLARAAAFVASHPPAVLTIRPDGCCDVMGDAVTRDGAVITTAWNDNPIPVRDGMVSIEAIRDALGY